MRWRWHLVAFVAVFIVTWSAFAGLWLAISTGHTEISDARSGYDVGEETGNESSSFHTVSCVENVNDFWTALMFSIETQSTIG
jgi:potassium inwardly-rectifying channel subfamily J, other